MKNIKKEILNSVVEACLSRQLYKTKADEFYDKIKKIKNNKSDSFFISKYPMFVCWKINSYCNLRCKHCYFNESGYDSTQDLSTKNVFKIIEQLSKSDILHIKLSGGEIFLRKDIIEIITKIKEKNIQLGLTTNATLINEKLANQLSDILNKESDYINVSLDGACEETHDFIRGKGTFCKTIENIKLLSSKNINITLNSTITNHNIHEMKNLYNLAGNLNAKKISFSKIIPFTKSQKKLLPTFEDLVIAYADFLKNVSINEKTFLENNLFNLFDFTKSDEAYLMMYEKVCEKDFYKGFNCAEVEPCHNGDKVYIDADGTVYLCNIAGDFHAFPMGNLKEKSFKAIWNNKNKNELFKKRNFSNSKCKNCLILPICKATCPVTAYLKYKTINEKDGRCHKI